MIFRKFVQIKSLALVSLIVTSLLFIAVIGSMAAVNYVSGKRTYMSEMTRIGTTLSGQMDANNALLNDAHKLVEANKTDEMLFTALKRQFQAMTHNTSASNAYMMLTDKIEKDGKTYLTTIQDASEPPGTLYEMPPIFLAGYDEVIAGNSTLTAPYTDQNGMWITYLAPVIDDKGEVLALFGLDFDYDQVEHDLQMKLLNAVGIGLIAAAIAVALMLWLIRSAIKPLRTLAHVSKQAASGDLTVSIPVKGQNEIAQAAQSFNQMIHELGQLTAHIKETSGEVSRSATDLQQSAEQTALATQEIAESIQEVAGGSETQLQSSQDCQRAMTEMAVGIQRIAESSSVVSDLAAETSYNASEGQAVMRSTVAQMQAIEQNLVESVEAINNVAQLGSRINEILAMISDVANQTNLLALNASIEAARAGEHGRGFAVVATEIRKLAERSKESSEQISAILKNTETSIKESVVSLTHTTTEARAGSDIAHQAGETFRTIVESIRQVSEQVQEVSAASEEMSASSEEIAASLMELERIASGSSMNATRVAASSEQQLATMEEVASSSDHLRHLADQLNHAVGRFKV
ncbi:methyl-accepting chemotaxis protein [Paenibacillus phyllosphaerae]|uniref:Methyl-accepting chemotaxis protein n=1 Tax=Paenibacillus phyllosphaerae TaxID=274593 RepID=A0A7W5AWQ7_9BACL|nr:methyl-accepting chemotaxis protein [Paenibacillus phyllosphaerae]MBB3109997.1 methyl-accepting chemotaxis protein [Paenibacillus phyllosphaerae]